MNLYIQLLAMTSSVVGLRSSKPFPKSKPAPKKFMSTVWWSAANLIHCSFLNPGKTITSEKCAQQIDAIHGTLQCLQLCSTERPQFFSMTTPDHTVYHQCFKSWMNWATMSYLICHIHLTSCQLTITSSSISTTFCRENVSTTSRKQKMLSKSFLNSKAWSFMPQE